MTMTKDEILSLSPGRSLDMLVHRLVMGLSRETEHLAANYSTSVEAAMRPLCVARRRDSEIYRSDGKSASFSIREADGDRYACWIGNLDTMATGDTIAHAVCQRVWCV